MDTCLAQTMAQLFMELQVEIFQFQENMLVILGVMST